MGRKYAILLFCIITIASCGPRSGILHENEKPVCDVTKENKSHILYKNESQLNGQTIFIDHCTTCHQPIDSPTKDGFRMEGLFDRIPKGNWFFSFIRNSDSLKKSGDAYSNKIEHDYEYDFEHDFKNFTPKEIEDLYNYLRLD